MSDDAIQDLLDHYDLAPESDADGNMRTSEPSSHIVARAQSQHTANRNVIASLRSSLACVLFASSCSCATSTARPYCCSRG